jgi:DNA-binding HxlR family transcriptional regulator
VTTPPFQILASTESVQKRAHDPVFPIRPALPRFATFVPRCSPRHFGAATPKAAFGRANRGEIVVSELLFQSKWRVQILCALRTGPVRLGQLARLIPPRSFEENASRKPQKARGGDIVVRKDLTDVVLHIEHHLEPRIRQDVCALLDEMARWGNAYLGNRRSDEVWRS